MLSHGNKVPTSGTGDEVKNGGPCFGPDSLNMIKETFRNKKLNGGGMESWLSS